MLNGFDFLLVGFAALLAGAINAIAGGGTLAQMKDLQGQKSRLWLIVPANVQPIFRRISQEGK